MYKLFLAGIILTLVIVKIIFHKQSTTGYHNYLYKGSTTLKQHSISDPNEREKRKIVILGNSSVAGSNIPFENNVSDKLNYHLKNFKAYNLGIFQANTFEMLAFFDLSLKYKPEVLMIGINPDLFTVTPSGSVTWAYYEKFKNVLSPEIYQRIVEDEKSKGNFISKWERFKKVAYPPWAVIWWKSQLFKLRKRLYGSTLNPNIWGRYGKVPFASPTKEGADSYSILKEIISLAKSNGVKVIAYLDPILMLDRTFGSDQYRGFKEEMVSWLESEDVPFFDYTNSLEENKGYFLDYIHLNPVGYARLAELLYKDIKGLLND